MNQRTPLKNQSMVHLRANLHQLDILYHSYPLDEYERTYHEVEQQVQQGFPGFTIAYAELFTAGSERFSHGGMRHVVVPQEKTDTQAG